MLLFGSRKVEYVDGVIRLDNWINLDMNPQHAASIVALRPALESLVVRASKDPETILELSPIEEKVLRESKSGIIISFVISLYITSIKIYLVFIIIISFDDSVLK